jgi:hypothetical protein
VTPGGSVQRSSGGVSASLSGGNQYTVTFGQDVTRCAYVAALGGQTNDIPIAGEAAATQVNGQPSSLLVQTWDTAGNATSKAFHLIVAC